MPQKVTTVTVINLRLNVTIYILLKNFSAFSGWNFVGNLSIVSWNCGRTSWSRLGHIYLELPFLYVIFMLFNLFKLVKMNRLRFLVKSVISFVLCLVVSLIKDSSILVIYINLFLHVFTHTSFYSIQLNEIYSHQFACLPLDIFKVDCYYVFFFSFLIKTILCVNPMGFWRTVMFTFLYR